MYYKNLLLLLLLLLLLFFIYFFSLSDIGDDLAKKKSDIYFTYDLKSSHPSENFAIFYIDESPIPKLYKPLAAHIFIHSNEIKMREMISLLQYEVL